MVSTPHNREQQLAAIVADLNRCLIQLDQMEEWTAGAHLSQAIAALIGQEPPPPADRHEVSN